MRTALLLIALMAIASAQEQRPSRPRPTGEDGPRGSGANDRETLEKSAVASTLVQIHTAGIPRSLRRMGLSAKPLPESEQARTTAALERELARYPQGFLLRHLDCVSVFGRLAYDGIEIGGTYTERAVLIANYGIDQGSTDEWLGECLHHEISSLLLRANGNLFPHDAWKKTLPQSFRYGRGGFAAVLAGRAGESTNFYYLHQGFPCEYAVSSFEEDFNSIAERLFAHPQIFRAEAQASPRLAKKRELIRLFYCRMDPRFATVL